MAGRRGPTDRFGARLDQIGTRLDLMSRAVDRWLAAGAEPNDEAMLRAMRDGLASMLEARDRMSGGLRALARAGFEPGLRGHSTMVLTPGMRVAVKRERLPLYRSIWPNEPLDRLIVVKMVGSRPVVRGRRRNLGIIPKAHLVTAT